MSIEPLGSKIPATPPERNSQTPQPKGGVSDQQLAGQKEQFGKILSAKQKSDRQAKAGNDPLQPRHPQDWAEESGKQEKITRRERDSDELEQNDAVQVPVSGLPASEASSVADPSKVDHPLATDDTKRSQVLEQMRVACERIAVSQDKTAVRVQLNSQVLANCSMTVTKAEDGTLAFVFNTQASDSADFLHRNAQVLAKAMRNELNARVDVKVVHSDSGQSQRDGSSSHQRQRNVDEFA